MYRIIILLLAVSLISCRAKKETYSSNSNKSSVDSTASAFKYHLNDSLSKYLNYEFTKWEFQTPAVKSVTEATPLYHPASLKSVTKGKVSSGSNQVKKTSSEGAAVHVKKKEEVKAVSGTKYIKPATGNVFKVGLFAFIAGIVIALYLSWKQKWFENMSTAYEVQIPLPTAQTASRSEPLKPLYDRKGYFVGWFDVTLNKTAL